ncbi:hypothetical protein D3C78_1312200 [compost metagenome]
MGPGSRHGDDSLIRGTWPEVAHQFRHIFREVVGTAGALAAQRTCGHLVGTGRAPQAQINPARIQAFQGAELLGNHQGCVVGQHHTARTDTNGRRATGQITEQYRCRGTGDAVHVVVLSHPEAVVTELLDMLRQVQRVAQRLGRAAVLAHRHQIEGRELDIGQSFHKPASPIEGAGLFLRTQTCRIQKRVHAMWAYTRVSIAR